MTPTLTSRIEARAKELFGKDFAFRDGQVDAIASIVGYVLSRTKHIVLEAPTGSGKSIVGLLAAYFLYKEHKMKSYILVSDLSLFDQYAADIDRLHSSDFGYIKGKENYLCSENGCKVSQAICSLQGMSIMGAANSARPSPSSFACTQFCKYAHDYMQAVKAPITLMTYQLYFIQRNYVEDNLFHGRNPNFPKRDLTICDECHKICDICQSHFAPRISIERPEWMKVLDKYMPSASMSEDVRISILCAIELSIDNDEMMAAVCRYGRYVANYCAVNDNVRQKLAGVKSLSKTDRRALAAGNMARQEHCKIDDMLAFVAEIGSTEHIVKTAIGNEITINFVYDSMMLKKYMHAKSKTELLMSATIGDFNEYAMLAGLDTSSMQTLAMSSAFDFSKSPIYVSNGNKMSAALKSISLPAIASQVASICRSKQHMRGIVQTGSYQNAAELKRLLPNDVQQRCIFYGGTDEKKLAIDAYQAKDDAILVGPTLIEGLNFPDSMCRFQICIKVPYAYLGSEYVKKKARYLDGWYEYDVVTKICQGIGRGIRHKDDWCETYILDGCIMNIINKLEDIPTLSHRFKLYL